MGCCDAIGQVVFALLLIVFLLPVYFIAALGLCINRCIPCSQGLSKMVILASSLAFRAVLTLCFWIHIDFKGFNDFRQKAGASGRPVVIVANHMSFLDVILAVTCMPLTKVGFVRMFVSNHLLHMPGLGTIVRGMGHLAVPFKTSTNDSNKFELDAEKMAERMKQLKEHVQTGNFAAWFPEGRMNRNDPKRLEVFRAGGFTIPVQLDVEVWGIAFVGNAVSWPSDALVGGKPARIGIKMIQICTSSKECIDESSAAEHDERQRCIYLANLCQDKLQEALDEFLGEGYIASATNPQPDQQLLLADGAPQSQPTPRDV